MSLSRYTAQARAYSGMIARVLHQRGLPPYISRTLLASSRRGTAWLFAELEVARLTRLEGYIARETLHQISTALHGAPVLISNSSGLRYAVPLSNPPDLPVQIELPVYQPGLLQIGQQWDGQPVTLAWSDLQHMLIAGITRSGKSNLIRLILAQALRDNLWLVIVDPDGRTAPVLAGHPQLLTPLATGPDAALPAIQVALAELEHRAGLYAQVGPQIDTLENYNRQATERLPHILVVIDEFNGLVLANGGPRGALAQAGTRLAWGGLKFGIHLILAGQDFTKEIVGPVREQMGTRVCFQVAAPSTSRVVLGHPGAERLTTPGRALTNRWDLMQVYQAKALPVEMMSVAPAPVSLPAPQTLVSTETAMLAKLIRPLWIHGASKRAMAQSVGQEYAGAFCRKLDAAINHLAATTTQDEPQNDGIMPGGDE